MGKYYFGFDAGTQSVKVGMYSESIECIAEYTYPTTLRYPKDGWVEMDVNEYVDAVKTGLRECMSKASALGIRPDEVRAIFGDGIICGIVGVDEDLHAITQYINYLDSRTQEDVDYINSMKLPIWAKESGNPEANCMFPAMFARWFLKESPVFREKGRKFVHNAPYILGTLAGLKAKDIFIDWGTMSAWGLGPDVTKKEWSSEQLDILGIPVEYMPRVVKPWDIIGYLTKDIADEIGLVSGIPICAGAGDTMQSMLGCGLTEVGDAADVAGTCSMFCVFTDGIVPSLSTPGSGLIFNSGTLENMYFYWGFIRTGGLALRWFRDYVCMQEGNDKYYDLLSAQAASVPPGCNGVQFLPYLTGGFGDFVKASGCFLNMNMDTNQSTMWKAVLEAIGYDYITVADSYRGAGIKLAQITCTEGGSRSELWNQIKADMLGTKIRTLNKQGGALLTNIATARFAVGDGPDLKQAINAWIETKHVYEPNGKNTQYYRDIYNLRKQLVEKDMLQSFDTLINIKDS